MARYREELARQLKLLAETASLGMADDEEDDSIEWEEGQLIQYVLYKFHYSKYKKGTQISEPNCKVLL